jgi:hypothetical protein
VRNDERGGRRLANEIAPVEIHLKTFSQIRERQPGSRKTLLSPACSGRRNSISPNLLTG